MKDEIIKEWVELYNSPMSAKSISEKYSVSQNTVLKYLRINDVEIRNTSPLKVSNKRKFNENYFNEINSEDKAYFLGLLYADGNISSTKYSYTVKISLSKKDNHILEEFISYFEGDHHLYNDNKRDQSTLTFSSKKIINDLYKIGMFPNKTYSIEYPKIDKDLNRHFIRGFFDGDGCIHTKLDKRTGHYTSIVNICCASKPFIEKLVTIMNNEIDININKIRNPKGTYNLTEWGSMRDIESIYEYFYKDSSIYLKRKKIKFDRAYEICKLKNKYRKR